MGYRKRHDGVEPGRTLEVEEVFFDFEGTLVNFQWKLEPAVEECLAALEAVGFKRQWFGPTPSYASIYNDTHQFSLEGRGHGDPRVDMAIIDSIYDIYDADALTRWSLYPDTLEMLTALHDKGFQLGLISNIGKKSLGTAMDRLGLSERLAVVISRDDVERLKPDAGGLLQAAAVLKVDPAHVIFIGDSRKDVDAARRAGMLAGFIAGGEEAPQTMLENPADIQINRLSELPPRLRRRTSATTG
jgi:HAD superfamily hydrolase (TIGR01509 family)